MKTNNATIGALAALLIAAGSLTAQNILTNGSFEDYGGHGFNSNIGAGLSGWTIGVAGGIDIVFSTGVAPRYWQAADGKVSLSLNYFGPDSVSQLVPTTPGIRYNLSFFMAAEVYGGPPTRTMDVLWNGAVVANPSFQYTGQGPTNVGWVQFSYAVVGTGTDTLMFRSTTAGPYGPVLDAVSLVAIPAPVLSIRCSQVELCWNAATNKMYQLQYRSDLTTNTWMDLGSPVAGNGTTSCVADAVAPGQPQRFYRIQELP